MIHDAALAALALTVLLALAHGLGRAFVWLRQPRVVGEILAGALVAPPLLALVLPEVAAQLRASRALGLATDAVYAVGLVALMFLSGARMNGLLPAEDRRAVAWLATVGTLVPFLIAVAVAPLLQLDPLLGAARHGVALTLVLGIAVAVTSIPVISRIFHDLGVLQSRFARLVLGVAVVEDIALWVVLAIALSLVQSSGLPWTGAAAHLARTLVYVVLALTVLPPVFRRATAASWNRISSRAPTIWLLLLLALSCALAHAFGVSLVFGSFFGGLAIGPLASGRWEAQLERIGKVAFATVIPVYFAIVGFRLDLVQGFSPAITAALLVSACAVKLASVGVGARLAGFRGLDVVNLAVATNARGGPGIVLASVALEASIVSQVGYTALIVLAVLTSQLAGVWLEGVLRRGRPLLTPAPTAGPSTT